MKTRIARTAASLAVLLMCALSFALDAPAAHADLIVSPGLQTSVEGNIFNGFPFNIGMSSLRYQQVYAASDFSTLLVPQLITQIAFRPDASSRAFNSTLSDIQINFSTTTAAPDMLSNTFSSNVGLNDTIVYNRGMLPLSSASTGPAGGPKDFDILINLNTPFLYNPSAGNLLLDVRNFGGGITTQFDAQSTAGDSVSRVYTGSSGNVNSTTAQSNNTLGLVTRFTTVPAPEPGTMSLMAIGLASLGATTRKRKKTQDEDEDDAAS